MSTVQITTLCFVIVHREIRLTSPVPTFLTSTTLPHPITTTISIWPLPSQGLKLPFTIFLVPSLPPQPPPLLPLLPPPPALTLPPLLPPPPPSHHCYDTLSQHTCPDSIFLSAFYSQMDIAILPVLGLIRFVTLPVHMLIYLFIWKGFMPSKLQLKETNCSVSGQYIHISL